MASTPNSFLYDLFSELDCIQSLEFYYWSEGFFGIEIKPKCQRCGSKNIRRVRKIINKPDLYQCNNCKRQFNIFTNTTFQGTKIPLRKWFEANWYYRNSYKPKVIASKLNLTLRDTQKLISKIKRLDEERARIKGYIGFGFLWEVRRNFRRKLGRIVRIVKDIEEEALGAEYNVRPKNIQF